MRPPLFFYRAINELRKGNFAIFITVKVLEDDVPRRRGNQSARPFGPLNNKDCPLRKIILPANRLNILLVLQTVEIHVHEEATRLAKMLLNNAESRRSDASLHIQRGGKALRERRLACAKVAFKTDDITRLERRGKLLRQIPRLLDGVDFVRTLHFSNPSLSSSAKQSRM